MCQELGQLGESLLQPANLHVLSVHLLPPYGSKGVEVVPFHAMVVVVPLS
jgi:hypothetical protein